MQLLGEDAGDLSGVPALRRHKAWRGTGAGVLPRQRYSNRIADDNAIASHVETKRWRSDLTPDSGASRYCLLLAACKTAHLQSLVAIHARGRAQRSGPSPRDQR